MDAFYIAAGKTTAVKYARYTLRVKRVENIKITTDALIDGVICTAAVFLSSLPFVSGKKP